VVAVFSGIDAAPPGGQSYVERRPAPALAAFVSSVWVQQIAPDAGAYPQRNLPSGGVELVWPLGSAPRVVGPLTGPQVETITPGTTIVGLRFRPGAAAAALDTPPSELVDTRVNWSELARHPMGRALDIAEPAVAAAELQRLVVARLGDADELDPLVARAVRLLMPWQSNAVRSLTTELYISERQLRRRCLDAVGLAPKTLHRILRFQGFLALVQSSLARGPGPADDGLDRLAVDAGYADQAHLTRECVRLAGVPPRSFLGDTQRNCACGHDHSASFTPLLRARQQVV
jgi:AraC-like DNA-binding protein